MDEGKKLGFMVKPMGRLPYLLNLISISAVSVCFGFIAHANWGWAVLALLLGIPLGIYAVACHVRRLHDLCESGWSVLLLLVPLVNLYILLHLVFEPRRAGPPRWDGLLSTCVDYLGMTVALVVLVVVFGVAADNFLTQATFRTLANQIADVTIAAVGMTFVLIIAGIDLSVGSVMALAGAALGIAVVNWGAPLAMGVVLCLLTGLACGAANGLIVIRWSLPSFIVTLGMLEAARGAAYLVTDSRTIYINSIDILTEPVVAGLSAPFFLAIAVVFLGQLILSRTVFGRYLVAIGTNEEAVRLSGIDPRPYKLAVFALSGLLAAVAAVIQTARMSSANPNTATGFELQVIAAVVIGGTSLMGGRGSVVRSFFGVLIIAVLGTGLAQVGAQEYTKRLITGCVIVAAVILDQYRHRSRRTDSLR